MKITVIIPSFNHEKYIGQAIQSVLNQTRQPDEIIVIDDASSDNTRDVIAAYDVEQIYLEKNVGGAEVLNIGIRRAKGELIAILNSDDLWHADKLKVQEKYLKDHPEVSAVFTDVNFINEVGDRLAKLKVGSIDLFKKRYGSSAEYLNGFFFRGNCLCHPSVLIRRNVYDKVGLYNNALRQLPDFHMWTRVIKEFRIDVISEKLVSFRILGKARNTSSRNYTNRSRILFEHYYIARSFFTNVDDRFFSDSFSDCFQFFGAHTPLHYDIEKALLFLKSNRSLESVYRVVGIECLMRLCENIETKELLHDVYGISDTDIHLYAAEMDIFLKDRILKSKSLKSRLINILL